MADTLARRRSPLAPRAAHEEEPPPSLRALTHRDEKPPVGWPTPSRVGGRLWRLVLRTRKNRLLLFARSPTAMRSRPWDGRHPRASAVAFGASCCARGRTASFSSRAHP